MNDPDYEDRDAAREERLTKNELLFREANELTAKDLRDLGAHVVIFLCECSSRRCLERVELRTAEYEHVRASSHRFFVVPGHEVPAMERIVEQHQTYLVVEKTGVAGALADAADPRTDHTL